MFKHIRNRAEWSDKTVSQKGFTLIELLVVIAILGILAVVGVLSFGGLTGNAKHATAKTELTEVQTAVDALHGERHGGPDRCSAGRHGDVDRKRAEDRHGPCSAATPLRLTARVTFASTNTATANPGCPTSGTK